MEGRKIAYQKQGSERGDRAPDRPVEHILDLAFRCPDSHKEIPLQREGALSSFHFPLQLAWQGIHFLSPFTILRNHHPILLAYTSSIHSHPLISALMTEATCFSKTLVFILVLHSVTIQKTKICTIITV